MRDRAVLITGELVRCLLAMIVAGGVLWLMQAGWQLAAPVTVLVGAVHFPPLMPALSTPSFSTKGFVLGSFAWGLLALVLLASNCRLPPGWRGLP
ncbi:MAG: hypothetical protein ACUVTG_11755 [Candidatus Oleimicrobiaceae bacterium]